MVLWWDIAVRERLRLPRLELPSGHRTNFQHPIVARCFRIPGHEVATAGETGYGAERDVVSRAVRVAEHVVEDRLGQDVEVGEDLAALCPEGVGVVEDRSDAALLRQRGKRDLKALQYARVQLLRAVCGGAHLRQNCRVLSPEHRGQEGRVKVPLW